MRNKKNQRDVRRSRWQSGVFDVKGHQVLCVQWEVLVRIHGDKNVPNVGVDVALAEAHAKVVQDGAQVEVTEVDHVRNTGEVSAVRP